MKNEINGKVVAITGASSGIGEAIARVLAAQGAKIVMGARRTENLEKIALNIREAGGEAVYTETDVTRKQDLEGLVKLACNTYGRLDVLINNAGISKLSKMDELDVEGWEAMIDVNVKGVLYGIAAALPVFKTQGNGHIINIISTAGLKIVPMMAVYAGSKNAVRTISEGLRQESDGRWRVTGISPGFVKTELIDGIADERTRAAFQQKSDEIAIAPEDIASAVVYAISQPANVDVGDIVIRPAVQD